MRKFLSFLLSLALVLGAIPMQIWADDAITFSAVKSDNTVTVTLSSKTYENVITAEAIVEFPNDVLELKSVNAGSFPPLAFESPNLATANTRGRVSLGFTNDTLDLTTFSGTIATLVFEVKDGVAPGSYTISLTKFDMTADDSMTNLAASDFTATMDATFVVTTEVSAINPTVAAPVKGGTPQTSITATEYTGTINWDPNDNPFKAETAYTATVTLTAKPGYLFTADTAISVAGASNISVTNVATDGSTITFKATFPATAGKDAQTLEFTNTTVNKTFGDADFTITATHSVGDGTVTYESDKTSVATVDASTGAVSIKGAGEAVITATAAETANYAAATASYTLTVAKADQTLSFANSTVSKTYGNDAFTEAATHSFGDGAVTYASSATAVATVNASSGKVTIVGAGSATITATAAATDNCNEATASYKLTVEKANVAFTAPAAKTDLKYTGSAQELIVAGVASGGEMQYSLTSGGTYSATIPTGTDAGNYTVYWQVIGDANHNDATVTSPIAVTIAKDTDPATVTATTTVKINHTADLSALVKDAAGDVSYEITTALTGCSVATDGTFTAGATTGPCVVTVKVADSLNYNGKTVGTITVTVVEKDPQTLEFGNPTVTKTYGDDAFTIEASHTVGDGAVTYASSDTSVATVDPSTGEVTILKFGNTTITATAAATIEYAAEAASYTLTVNKAEVTVTAKDHTITYGDAPANNGVEYSGFKGSDTQSVVSGSVTYDYSYTQYGAVGSNYTITPVVSGLSADNYTFTAVAGTLTVGPKEAVLSWTGGPFDYDGFVHVPTATVENLAPGDSCDVTVTGGQTNAGEYTATATELKNTNYKLPANATHAFKINKAASSVTAAPAAISGLEYTGSAQALVTVGTANGGEMQYSLTSGGTYSATIPTGTDASTYNVYYKVKGDNNHNDTDAAGPVAVTIAKGPQTLAFADAAVTKTYGEAAFTVAASQTPASGGGDVSYASSDTTVATVTNSGEVTILKAGSATITVTAAENTNCLLATASYTLTVNKAPLTVKAKDNTITYGEAPADNGLECTGFVNGDTDSVLSNHNCTYTYAQYDDVGEYAITPADTITADNYTITTQSGKLTVKAREAKLSWTGDSFNYDGSEHAPTATVTNLVNSDTCTVTVDGAQTNAGSYTATATALSNSNYKLPASATHNFTINKAASSVDTVPAAVSGLEYTGNAQALVSAGAATGGEVQYSLTAGGPYSAEAPTATDAGTYNVYYKVVGDANHDDIAEAGPITVTIAKGTDPAALTKTAVSVKLEGTEDLSALVSGAVGTVSYNITSALDGCSVAADGTFTTGTTEGTCVVTVAVAESTNYNGKTLGTITIDVKPMVETPVLSPASQNFSGKLEVTITCTSGAAIYYTLDGSDPTSASTLYTEPISLNTTTAVKAIATMAGHLDSEIAEETYTLKPSGGPSGGTTPATNTVTPAEAENGKVTANTDNAAAGDTVTLTVTPDEGYQLASIVVKDADGNEIEVTEKDGKYTFTMPDSEVTIETVFEEASETPSDTGRFIDVHEGDYYYEPVEWAAENGITNGITKDKFGPALGCTRAQVVTFLWIAYGSQDAGTETGFDDVDLSDYYDKAVAWAVSEGITAGTAPNEFSPDLTVTRCQFVTMLWVSRGMPEAEGTMPFTDVPADAYYAKAVAWAYANDITAGKSATRFAPDDPCTRGQIVTFLYNALAE